ncbi:hypothetical protein IKP85_01315 [bacterium]|nr:hypothetical protein [bacterium]
MEKIKDFIKKHLDFQIYQVTWIAFAVFLAIPFCLEYMPQKYGYENGLLESIQFGVLFVIFGMCFTAKVNRRFFKFCALILTIIMIREVNCGRTLFLKIPGTENSFYPWRDLKYGFLVHPIYGLYIAIIALYFIIKKHVITLWKLIKGVRLPFWNIAIACFAMLMGAIAEEATNDNFIFEEGFELLFYVCLAGIVYLYSRHDNFMLEVEE